MLGENNRKANGRAGSYKKTVTTSDGRRIREHMTIQIRKQKKEQRLKMRRSEATKRPPSIHPISHGTESLIDETLQRCLSVLRNHSSNPDHTLEATRSIRRILCRERDPPTAKLVNGGIITLLVQVLVGKQQNFNLLHECTSILIVIAGNDEFTNAVAQSGAIGPLVNLMYRDEVILREQAMCCLGNIAGDGIHLRDQILQHGAMHPILKNIEQPSSMSLVQQCVWCTANLCRGKPAPDRKFTDPIIFPLVSLMNKLLAFPGSEEAISDLTWALSYLSDGDENQIGKVMDTKVTRNLVFLLLSDRVGINQLPILRTLGNFVSGNDEQVDEVLEQGFLDCVPKLFNSDSRSFQTEVMTAVYNIAAGTPNQRQRLWRKSDIIKIIVKQAKDGHYGVKREALLTLSILCTAPGGPRIVSFLRPGTLEPLVMALKLGHDVELLTHVLDAIDAILAHGRNTSENGYTYFLDEYDGINLIEELQEHECKEVYERVVRIIENYLGFEEEEIIEGPKVDENGNYSFGLATTPKKLFVVGNVPSTTDQQSVFGGRSMNQEK